MNNRKRQEGDVVVEGLRAEVAELGRGTRWQLVLLALATGLLCVALGVYFFGSGGRFAAPMSLVASLCGLGAGVIGLQSSHRNVE